MASRYMYVIMPVSEIDNKVINLAVAEDLDNIRKSANQEECVLKLQTPIPEFFLDYVLYYHSEILLKLQEPEWLESE